MWTVRFLNMDLSLNVFCGKHVPDYAKREIFDKYWLVTRALELVNFPFAFPGTKVYRAKKTVEMATEWLRKASASSREAMAKGGQSECLMDEWMKAMSDLTYKSKHQKEFSDQEVAMSVFSFLFASQDAMASALIFGFQLLADHPKVVAKLREEQECIRHGDFEAPLTLELMDKMPYLQATVKEVLRLVSPVMMVPYKATRDFPLSENYTVPAGSMVIPAYYPSLHDPKVYPDPDSFIPERWLDPNGMANTNPQYFLVYGSGPHRCIGQEYANISIGVVLATLVVMFDMEHEITPDSYKIKSVLFHYTNASLD
ncbi:RNA polymerase C-22 sterol desaturase [Stygiomarasmius scandens]|uniref:sterol 22-desaturase n=1 Tax=Marasmiellus scandens TaxID=2682957 RepID=A0ABR1JE67_9AGAR